ncbi:glycosyltransferase family 4 protein [soil metagenome]
MVRENRKIEKVLITADTIGGVWTYVLELARAFQPYDVNFYVATMGKGLSNAQLRDVFETPNMEIFSSRYKLEWMQDPWNDIEEAGNWLLDLQDQINPDIIHLNNYSFGNLNWNAPVVMVAHSCVLSWWQAVKKEPATQEWNEYYKKVRDGLRAADLVVGVSQSFLKHVKNYYGPFVDSMFIYNGLDHRKYYIKNKSPYIFAMGRIWDEGKNLRVLADIEKVDGWPIFIAGNNNDPSGFNHPYVSDCFLGQLTQENVKKYLSEASIFVHPAKYEPFGLAALEAGLSGCALILSDIPSLREIWNDNALYFDVNDKDSLKEAISKLIRNVNLREYYQQKAYERAKFFSHEVWADKYLKVYQKMIRKYYWPVGPLSDN